MSAPVSAPYQAQLLDPLCGKGQFVNPSNGRDFGLEEVRGLLQCQRLEVIYLTGELILVLDEEGKQKQEEQSLLNLLATQVYYLYQPSARGFDYIAGRAILCHPSQFK